MYSEGSNFTKLTTLFVLTKPLLPPHTPTHTAKSHLQRFQPFPYFHITYKAASLLIKEYAKYIAKNHL